MGSASEHELTRLRRESSEKARLHVIKAFKRRPTTINKTKPPLNISRMPPVVTSKKTQRQIVEREARASLLRVEQVKEAEAAPLVMGPEPQALSDF